MLEQLKEQVCKANRLLPTYQLVTSTWGNVSGIDRESGRMVIKPSGVEYSQLEPEAMVVVDLEGRVVEGDLRPSSDTQTHIELYKAFGNIGGIVHTHSQWATVFAQAERNILPYGTTHADYFCGPIPVTRKLTQEEIDNEYEKNTGKVIVELFQVLSAQEVCAVLVNQHGPFCWGSNALEAVQTAAALEQVAKLAYYTKSLNPNQSPISYGLLDRHYQRKHGKDAYYGQEK